MKHIKFILSIIIIIALIIFFVQNHSAFSTSVEFRLDLFSFHFKSVGMNIYYIIGISFLLGVFITGLCGITERFQLKKQIKTLTAISKEKDKELNSLRNLPITSDNIGSKKIKQ
jgi:uncharacterized integral membrane protein